MSDNKEKLFKMIKQMSPGDVMTFCAQQLGISPAEMLLKNAGKIALSAVKNGWAKASDLKDAVKNFSTKNKEDDTGIDWDNVEIDEATIKLQCLFDGDSGKKLKEFCQKLQAKMKDFAKEEKELNEAKSLNEATKLADVISKDAIDAIIKAAKNGGKIAKPNGDGYVIQSGDALARTILKRDFPDEYKKISSKVLGVMGKNAAWKKLGIIAHAARTGDDSKIETALKATGLFSQKVVKAAETLGSLKDLMGDQKEVDHALKILGKLGKSKEEAEKILRELHDMAKTPEGALRATAKLAEITGGGDQNASSIVHDIINNQKWYEDASSDIHNALNNDMDHISISGASELKDTLENGELSHENGMEVASSILADKAKDPKAAIEAAGPAKDAAKDMANDEEMKEEVAKKTGLKAFTPLGWARLAAKTTGYILNNGKDLVNWIGEKKIKNSEDKNVIAEIRTQIENAGDNQYADSEFSVRFTTDDFKWHATCIDDRKMSFNEQQLIDKVLKTDTVKKFKDYCLKKWKGLLNPAAGSDYAMLPFILGNLDKFGLKGDDAFFGKVKALADNMDKIEPQFK